MQQLKIQMNFSDIHEELKIKSISSCSSFLLLFYPITFTSFFHPHKAEQFFYVQGGQSGFFIFVNVEEYD